MIITKTPYRISFFGGGSDYPSWYLKNGGAVLSTKIDKFVLGFNNLTHLKQILRTKVKRKIIFPKYIISNNKITE